MIFVIVILLVFVFLIAWILFVPVSILVNTDADHYRISQPGVFSLEAHFHPEFTWEVRMLGIRLDLTGSNKKYKLTKKVTPQVEKHKTKKKSKEAWLLLIRGMVKSFHLTTFHLTIDTGDVVLNAKLIPVMYMISRGPVSLATNFHGRVYLYVNAEARLYRIIWTLIQFLTKK